MDDPTSEEHFREVNRERESNRFHLKIMHSRRFVSRRDKLKLARHRMPGLPHRLKLSPEGTAEQPKASTHRPRADFITVPSGLGQPVSRIPGVLRRAILTLSLRDKPTVLLKEE
jgi:hypothetical protein